MDELGRSCRARVGIRRPAEAERVGAQVINYWTQAAISDLHVYIQDACRQPCASTATVLANCARRWFRDAWRGGTGFEHRFPIESFTFLVYSQADGAGRVLIEVDVLSGDVLTLAY